MMPDQHTLNHLTHLILRWIAESIAHSPKNAYTQASYLITRRFYHYYAHLNKEQQVQLIQNLQELHVQNHQDFIQQIQDYYGSRHAQAIQNFIHVMYSFKPPTHHSLKHIHTHLLNYILFDSEHDLPSPKYHELKNTIFQILAQKNHQAVDTLEVQYWPQIESLDLIDILHRDYTNTYFLAKFKNDQKSSLYKQVQIQVAPVKDMSFFRQHLSQYQSWDHSSLVPVVEYGFIQGFTPLFWIATPYMQAITLQDFIDVQCEITIAHTISLSLMESLAHLHRDHKAHGYLSTQMCVMDDLYQIKFIQAYLIPFMSKITGMMNQTDPHTQQLNEYLNYHVIMENLEGFKKNLSKIQQQDAYQLLHMLHAIYTGEYPQYDIEAQFFVVSDQLPNHLQKIFKKYLHVPQAIQITAIDLFDEFQALLSPSLRQHRKRLHYRAWKTLFQSRDLLAFVHQNKGEFPVDETQIQNASHAQSFLQFAPQVDLFDHQVLNHVITELNEVEKLRYQQQLKVKELTEKASTYDDLAEGIAQEMIVRLDDMSGKDIYEALDEITNLKAKYLKAARDKVAEETDILQQAKDQHLQMIANLKQLHKDLLKKQVQRFRSSKKSRKGQFQDRSKFNPQEELTPIVEEDPPQEESTPVVEEDPPQEESTPVVEEDPPQEELTPIVEEELPQEESTPVVEEDPPQEESTPVVEEDPPQEESTPVVEDDPPQEESTPVVEGDPPQEESTSIVTQKESIKLLPILGEVQSVNLAADVQSDWCYCPAGSFSMGSPKNQGDKDEKPQHIVNLSQGFWLTQTPITQKQWTTLMGSNPSQYKGEAYPVERVSWYECVEFCNQLSHQYDLQLAYTIEKNQSVLWHQEANGFRLPTEAEWEYAAKAGKDQHFSGSLRLKDVAWYNNNSEQTVREVGLLKANEFKLKDMSGLVWEWCHDVWDSKAYQNRTMIDDPCVYEVKGNRVFRGGSWKSSSYECRVTCRSGFEPSIRWAYRGFRVCLPHR